MVTLRRPLRRNGNETVTVKPVGQKDKFGDVIPGTDEPFEIEGCAVYPQGGSEETFRSSTVTENAVMLAPVYETDLTSGATVTWRSRTYHVQGPPAPLTFFNGQYAGTQVNLKYAKG